MPGPLSAYASICLSKALRGEGKGNGSHALCRPRLLPSADGRRRHGARPAIDAATEACEETLARVASRAAGAEALATAVVGTSSLTRFANSRIHQNVSEGTRRVRLSVALDGRLARASTTRTDGDGLAALAERALAAAALRPADPDFAGFAPPAAVPQVDHWDDGHRSRHARPAGRGRGRVRRGRGRSGRDRRPASP